VTSPNGGWHNFTFESYMLRGASRDGDSRQKEAESAMLNRILPVIVAAVVLGPALSVQTLAAEPLSPAAQRGLTFVRANCARCHSVTKVGESPLRIAPPFRTLHEKYPVESLQESLAEGIITGHPTMPQFRLDPGQVRDVIAYLKTLE
jgi:mono/diheme cytochrome c family protein